jgi:endo-beta-N-acetylglucosaminidase D
MRGLHHVEVWVPDLEGALPGWRWLLESLGFTLYQEFEAGGTEHYAAYLEDAWGFEVELVAEPAS